MLLWTRTSHVLHLWLLQLDIFMILFYYLGYAVQYLGALTGLCMLHSEPSVYSPLSSMHITHQTREMILFNVLYGTHI